MGQKSILLRFVKTVNLIYKKDGAPTQAPFFSRPCNNFSRLFDARGNRAKRYKATLRRPGNNSSQRCLARTRWSPENHGRQAVAFDKHAKGRTRPNEVILPHNIVEHLGTQALGQRRVCHFLRGL